MKHFIIFSFVFCISCGHECKNFIIKEAHLMPVKLIGMDSLHNEESSYVLLRFDLKFVNCSSIFLGGVPEPGNQGIDGSLTSILILDSNHVDITDKFRGVGFKGNLIQETTDSMNETSFYSNVNMQELKDNINLHKTNERGLGLKFPRAFAVTNNIKWPLLFKMYFNNSDSLVQKMYYNEHEIKTYIIE